MHETKKLLGRPGIEYGHDMYDALIDANGLILATEWSEFRIPNFKLLARIMKEKVIFDGRNIYDPAEVEENGFTYYGIGSKQTACRMKRILVTGGAGFIGSHLCEQLLNEGNEVICLDNYFTGNKRNIVHLFDNPYFELVRHDVIMPYYHRSG